MTPPIHCPHCGIQQHDDNPDADPALSAMANLCWTCALPLGGAQ